MNEIKELPAIGAFSSLISQARLQPACITLFKGWTRLTTDDHGQMQGEALQGFFAANTRFLSHYEIKVNGEPVSHQLSAQLSANEWSTTGAILGSGESGDLPEGKIPNGSIEVRRLRKIDQGMSELIFVKNNGSSQRDIELTLELSCPLSDQEFSEEMKNEKSSPKKGIKPKVSGEKDNIKLQYYRDYGARKNFPEDELRPMYGSHTPREGSRVTRTLTIQIRPRLGGPTCRIDAKRGKLSSIRVKALFAGREELCLEVNYSVLIDETELAAPHFDSLAVVPREKPGSQNISLEVNSSNSTLNQIIAQAQIDLRDLELPIFGKTDLNADDFMAYNAGIPRYIGLFGRDNLVTAWQSPLFGLQRYEPVLKRLGLLQGVKKDDSRDEEPSRFLHERRLDPRAETGEVNRQLYYGEVTSTPFWIIALWNLYQWTGEKDLLVRHQDTVIHAVKWVLSRLKEGNGFIYYAPSEKHAKDENRNQAWKDSGDAIVDQEGKVRTPPLAVAEIQGYAYRALIEAHHILRVTQPDADHSELLAEACLLKERFNEEFFLDETNFYAVALDKDRAAVASHASNIGHCIDSGILGHERISLVSDLLMSDEFFSGWGIRTLSSENPAFDPFSYHRGAVWPVENAFIAHGLSKKGFHNQALRIITAQLSTAALFPHLRLPEVLSGHSRTGENPTPGLYNFANLFQAWSVSAITQNLQTILGVYPQAQNNLVYLRPDLPTWLQWIELKNLHVGKSKIHLRIWRDEHGQSHFQQLNSTPEIEIRLELPPEIDDSQLGAGLVRNLSQTPISANSSASIA